LRGIFTPKLWKLQVRKSTAVKQVDNLSTIHRIARQSIRMPSKNSVCIAVFNPRNHFVENRTTDNFGRLLFDKLLGDMQTLLLGKGAQFCDLRFNTQNLLVLYIGGLAGVEKIFIVIIHAHTIIGQSKSETELKSHGRRTSSWRAERCASARRAERICRGEMLGRRFAPPTKKSVNFPKVRFWCVFTVWLEIILSEIPKNRQEAALRAAQTILCARAGKKKGGWGK